MNPLLTLNQRQALRKRRVQAFKAFVGCLFLTMLAAMLSVHYQVRFAPTIVEVNVEAAEPEVQVSAPSNPVQTARIHIDALSFDQGLTETEVDGVSLLSYAPAEPSDAKVRQPRIQLASHAPQTVAPKLEPKKPAPVLAQVAPTPRIKLSSENWSQMNGRQRWQFVAGYLASQHLTCPPSGMTRAQEEAKLEQYSWTVVRNFGFNSCSKSG